MDPVGKIYLFRKLSTFPFFYSPQCAVTAPKIIPLGYDLGVITKRSIGRSFVNVKDVIPFLYIPPFCQGIFT